MSDHLRELATEYTARVLARRKFMREDGPCAVDRNCRLDLSHSVLVQREAYFAPLEQSEDTNGRAK